jgi:hypothetical protein
MYYRNPDHYDVDRLTKVEKRNLEFQPRSLSNQLILSIGMIVAPVVTFFLVLRIVRLVAAL